MTAAAPIAKPVGISVAVLPFLNLSGDPKEEYFSDGMTEEITTALAKIPQLPVVGRTSAFAFKGKNEDMSVIGQALHATYLLEGSVRKEGNEVRITAQLIKAETGDHLWTDSYDRQLSGIFAVQEDVAKAIAAALQVPLGLKEGETLVSNRTSDTQSYEDYLRALALYRARNIKEVIAILEPMVKRDPTYAPAWALLAQAYNFEPVYKLDMTRPVGELRRERDSAYGLAQNAARKAIQLDPNYAPGYTALGYAMVGDNRWADADSEFQKALALDPSDPDTLHLYSLSLVEEGRLKQALKMRMTLRMLEPFVPIYNVYTAVVTSLNGDKKGAAALLEPLSPDGAVGAQRNEYLAFAYATQGRYALAADTILKIAPDLPYISAADARLAADILRKAPARIETAAPSRVSESELGWVYVFVGAPERFLDMPERLLEAHLTGARVSWLIFDPSLSVVHKSDRFKALMHNEGLVDYWRAHGWPDFCRQTTGDDFVCN
jgi:TolB-like protein/Flp pilus assembly protein TadD